MPPLTGFRGTFGSQYYRDVTANAVGKCLIARGAVSNLIGETRFEHVAVSSNRASLSVYGTQDFQGPAGGDIVLIDMSPLTSSRWGLDWRCYKDVTANAVATDSVFNAEA